VDELLDEILGLVVIHRGRRGGWEC
jgi:hypothetical protein